jgi:hypothetical protein
VKGFKIKYILFIGLSLALTLIIAFFLRPHSAPAGEDKDGNGLWDDVDQRIRAKYDDPYAVKGVTQTALLIQKALLQPENALAVDREIAKSDSCLSFVFERLDLENRGERVYSVRDLVVVGPDREKAWLKYTFALDGQVLPFFPEDRTNCAFDTSGL